MAGEIQIGGTTFATESGGTVTVSNVDSATNRTNLGLGSSDTASFQSLTINGVTNQGFPSGTKMMFQQTAAPTGWTKDTSHDNKALRVVSGNAGSGGSVAFTTAFASQAVSGSVGNTTLTTAQMPSHGHTIVQPGTVGGNQQRIFGDYLGGGSLSGAAPNQISSQSAMINEAYAATNGSSNAHNHSFTGIAINMDVQYVDLIIATKD